MKMTRCFSFRNSLLVLASLSTLFGSPLLAQDTPNAVGAAQLASAPVPPRITQAIDETQLTALKGSVHPLARPEFDRGAVPDATPMNRMLLLLQRSPAQEAALQQLMVDQMSKASPNFHNWLTPAQFGAQFGPADTDIQTVTNWLSAQGFHDIKVGTGKLTIEFSGNVGLVRHAFHTDIHHFFANGEMRQANVGDPQIPSALTPVVAGIVSLHNFPKKSMLHKRGVLQGTRDSQGNPQLTGPANCGTAGNPACFYALGPADFAAIYDIPTSTLNGTGSKIAIIGFSDINPQDVTDFRTLFGLPVNPPNIVHNGPPPGIAGEEGEADLDVEWSGAVAPMAQIDFVVSEDTLTSGGLELSSLYVVDNNTDDIMSLSFGGCEAGLGAENAFINALWEQGAAQGISVTVSSGDNGAAGCDDFNTASVASLGVAVNGLASTPFNVAVGGTDFDDVGTQTTFWNSTNAAGTRQSVKGYIPETTWNDSCAATATSANLNTVCSGAAAKNIVGGSGGPSRIYAKPSWQRGTGVPTANRNTPDVSLFASNGPQTQSFYLVCEADATLAGQPPSCASSGSFSFLGVGGTSASTPSFAGILALIEQGEANAGRSRRQGNANFVLYSIFQTAANSCSSSSRTTPATPPPAGCVFNDVTKGNNSVPCAGGSPNCSATTGTNGVLVEPSQTTTPAWTTTAGYDLATGLGSVNVANLQTAWGTAVGAFTPTTTNTKVNGGTSQVPLTHGASVTLSASVTSGSGTPTGFVSFPVPTTVNGGVGDAPLASGAASLSTIFLPGGSYTIKAHYAGDGTFAPSDDATGVPVTVNPEASGLLTGIITFNNAGNVLTTNAASVGYGSAYIFRMNILNHTGTAANCVPVVPAGSPAGSTTGCAVDATGTVAVLDNGTPLPGSPFSVNSQGFAEDQPIQLTGGMHTLSATYSGDISYSPPASPTVDSVNVSLATTATALSANPTNAQISQQVALSVTITSQSNSTQGPTGNVTFNDGTTAIGTVAVTPAGATANAGASATATLNAAFSSGGAHSITAVYAGDANYMTSTSTAVVVNVTPIGITATPVIVTAGGSGKSTVTVTPGGGFTGNVAITCAALPGVSCGALNINVTNANPASGMLSVSVAAPSSSTMAMVLPSSPEIWAATRPPANGANGRWWTLTALSGFAAVVLLLLPRRKRYRVALFSLGAVCLVTFAPGCGGGYGGGGGGGGVAATTTTVSVTSTKVAQGTNIAFTANVTSTGRAPGGQVQLFIGSTAIGPATPVSGGSASISVSTLPVGVTGISAHYFGDAYTAASQSGTLNIAVTGTTQLAITGTAGQTTASTNLSLTVN